MAAPVITNDQTVLSTFETDTGSLVREQTQSIQLEGTLFVQGAGSLGASDDGLGLNGLVSPSFTAQNITNTILFGWLMALTTPDTVANGGLRLRVEDGVGLNFGEFFVAGGETYDAGFKIMAVDTARTFDRTSATAASKTAINRVGIIANFIRTGIDGSAALIDVVRRGTGITITGGTLADPVRPVDVDAEDRLVANQFGMLQINNSVGAYVLTARFTIGQTTGTLLTVFRSNNDSILVNNMPLAAGQSQLTIESNATNPTDAVWGEEIGTGVESVGVGGGSITGTSTDPARTLTINSIDADTGKFELFGVSLVIGAKINLTGAFNKFVSCLVSGYDSIILRTSATVRGSTITDSVATPSTATSLDGCAVDLGTTDPAVDKFKDNRIQNSPRGILFNPSASGDLTLDNITFSGNAVCDNAQQFDSPSTFVSQTADANSVAANDVQFFPAVSVTGDAFILGLKQPGPRVRINIGQVGAGTYTLTPQYRSSPTVWTNLAGVTDGTNNFKTESENDVTFTVPTNWVATTEGGEGPFFHMRFLRNAGTMTANPLGTICFTGFDIRLSSGAGIETTVKVQNGGNIPVVELVTAGVVFIVAAQVTTLVTVLDGRFSPPTAVQNARVIVEASDATGDLNFEVSVTISRGGTVATVVHTAHGLVTGDQVNIQGANETQYNGVKTITFESANAYVYTVTGNPATPATGTITSTDVVLQGLTDVNGQISDIRSWILPQPIKGVARKSTATPRFKNSLITGTISPTAGLSQSVVFVLDE